MPSITHDQSMDSISDSIVHIGDNEIKECAIEALEPFKNELEAQGFNLNELGTSELIKTWSNIERFKDTKLNNDTELKNASDFTDLITGKIAGFDEEKLREMCTFSKISYGNVDEKLEKDGYKTRRQLEKEGYKIIKFYDNDLIQDQYCSDDGYKLKSQDVGYALKGNNSYNRDAGYIFIKGNEVTIAYHGTRDLNDVKEDLRASLAKLSFLPKDHRVHSGFYSLFKRSWPSVHKILQGHANDQGISIENLKINVTGHSMGGAIASIAALCLNKIEGAKDVHVATFGSPRVFYNGAAEVYNECLGNNTIRVACQSDLVPCLPHGNAGMHYKHVGKPLKLKTDKTLEYLEPHYHKIDTYYDLIKNVQQENFKSDNNTSKYFYIAYVCSIFYNAVLPYADVDDKEFFKKVEEENKDIKFSEIPAQYPPNLEEKFRQGEQEVAQLTNDKTQLEERLNSIQQSLAEKTEEFKSTQIQLEQERSSVSERLTQEQQKVIKLNSQVIKLTEEFKGIKDQLIEKEAELGKYNKTNAELEGKNSNLTNQLEELQKAEKDLKKNVDNLNNNEESNNKNENFLRAKKQVIYAAVSFASSTALAVSASLTIFHLAICISLAVTALTFLAVGCYCSYKANTALNNVKIENDSYRIAA